MRDHFCTPKALLEALKKSTLEGEEPDSTILELAKKAPTKTGAKKKALGDLQEQIYAKQNELNTLTTIKTYVNASEKAKQEASPIDAKTAEDYIRRIKEKQAKKELLNPKEKELLELNGKIMGMKLQISNALSETKKATLEKRRFDFEADAKRRVKLSDQTQKKLEALQAGGKELTDAEVYRSLLFDARKKNDAERLKEVRKEVKDLKAQQAKVLNEKKDALLEKLKKDPASITNEELSILETNAEKKVRLDIEKAQREQEKANKKIQKQLDTLEAKNSLLEALKNGDKESYLNDLQKKRFDAILKKENKTDLEKQLLAASKDLTKEKARIKQEHANIVFDALSNKENLTDDEQTVLNAIISKHKQELADKLDTYTNIETTQKKRLEALNKPIKTNPPEIEAQKKRVKDLNADLRNVFTDSYLRVSKADAEANGKQALVEAYKKGKFTDAEAEKLATNQHEINMRRLAGREGERTAHAKQLDKMLEEKGVKNIRTRQSIVDKLMMVARQTEDGNGTLDQGAFTKLAKKLIKDQLAVSDAGIPNAVEVEIRKLSKKIDEVNASDKRADIKNDEILALRGQINAELSKLIKPNWGDKFNMPLFVEPLLNIGSAVGDVLGSANAVASHAYLNSMTRFLMKFDPKDPKASLATLGKELKSINLKEGATNTGKAISKLTTGFINNVAFALDAGLHPIKARKRWVEARNTGTLWKPIQYALEGHVPLGHDDITSGKLRPAFAYENKGFKDPFKRLGLGFKNVKLGEIGGSFADLVETTVHHYEILGNIRLNATDMPFLDYIYRNRIGEIISDGLKQDPNFKLTEEDVKNAHAFTNWLLFKNDNVVSENIKALRDFFNFKLDIGGNKLTIPIGSIIERYTRTPTNVALRSLDVQGLADIRFLFGYVGKGLNKNKDEWVKQVREKYNDNVANKLDTGIDVVSKLLNAGITKYELKKGEKGLYYLEAQLDKKTNKPVLISDKQHDFEMVQGIVKLATTGTLGVAIYALAQNTDVFSTGYDKKTSDVQEAEETRNDFYFNPTALFRLTFGGNGRNQKGDTLIPLSKILGQHMFGAKTAVRLSKGEELNGDEANAVSDFFEASQNQFGEGTGLFNLVKFAKRPLETIAERLPKIPFAGSVGRDVATVIDDKERVTKTDSTLGTAWNQYLSGTAFRNTLPIKTDITGKNPKANGFGKALGFPFKIAKADPVIKELRQVSRDSGVDVQLKQVDNNFRIGKTLAEDYGIEPQNMKLNAQDFAKWQEIHNNMVYQSVKSVVESKDYKSLTDPLDKADEIKYAKENPFVVIDGKDYTPKELFLEYKLKGRVVKIEK